MALELTTDGNTQTSTTGNTGTSTTGETVIEKLGDHTESVLGSLFGYYLAFTRIVTGTSIDIQTSVSINFFIGAKIVFEQGAVYTISKLRELKVQKAVETDIRYLGENIVTRNQKIETSKNAITTLTETGETRTTNYKVEENVGDTSTEKWTTSKSITSGKYSLKCEEGAVLSVDKAFLIVEPSGVYVSGPIVEFN